MIKKINSLKILYLSFFFVLLLFMQNVVYAKIIQKNVVAEGSAINYSDAVNNALVQAVSQVKGVDISAVRISLEKISQDYKKNNDDLKEKTNYQNKMQNKIKSLTKGIIDSYSVISANENDGNWNVKVNAIVSEYQGVDEKYNNSNFLNIGILPFEVNINYSTPNWFPKVNVISETIKQNLVNQFTQSRKFRVLSNSEKNQKIYNEEMKLVNNGQFNKKEKSRFGQRIGADFIISGTVTSLNIDKKITDYYGTKFIKWNASISLSYEVLEIATMEIKWSNTVKYKIDNNKAKLIVKNESENSLLESLLIGASNKVANQIINDLYPVQVLKVSSNKVYLNQGADRVKKGTVYKVQGQGDVVKDPANGTHIYLPGETLAKVEVIAVYSKFSIAKKLEGSLADVNVGDIVVL